MKQNLVLLLLLCLFAPMQAQTEEAPQVNSLMNVGGTSQKDYYTVIPYEPVVGLPVVMIEMKGKQYRFLFDTGAATSIRNDLAEELGLDVVSKIPVKDAEGRADSLFVYTMPDILLGEVVFNGIPAYAVNKDVEFVKCLGLDGIIGSNLLRESIVKFSSKDSTITITDMYQRFDLQSKAQYASELFLDPFQSCPHIWTVIDDNDTAGTQVLFDTGMSGVFDIAIRHLQLFNEHKIFSDSIHVAEGSQSHSFHGKTQDTVQCRVRVPKFWVNKALFKNVALNSTVNDNSRIGVRFLKYGDVTIDYKNKAFFYEPFSEEAVDLDEKRMPISLTIANGKFVIGIIWDKSLQDKISVGDQVMAINGVDFDSMGGCELFTYDGMEALRKASNIFKIRDKDGNIKEVLIEQEK